MKYKRYATRFLAPIVMAAASAGLTGCPGLGIDLGGYDAGFAAGLAVDAEYWQGYDDSWDTRDGGEIFYSGSEIPELNDDSFDAGRYDGIWYAYNDGYFVAYDYAFVIGFTEGYDAAHRFDWLTFIRDDVHVEWLDGGFSDGYNDGFSEGRMLGAVDYDEGLPFDWTDALLFYKSGEDVFIEALALGTGEFGPVFLYEYGLDPVDIINGVKTRSVRKQGDAHEISYRTLPAAVITALTTSPSTALRGGRELTLDTTWLERINTYNGLFSKAATPSARKHSVGSK